MPWLQIRLATRPDHSEILEDALLLAGCKAVTLIDTDDKPVYEPIRGTTPLWEHTTIQGLFEEDVDVGQLLSLMDSVIAANQLSVASISTEILEDKDWEREWMDNFKPIACGDRLWIVPSWQSPPDPGGVNLKLDPGLAFGTGTHPTTFLCLQWLNDHIQAGDSVLDYGCGSGILGLAALLLGADRMTGIDIDPQALVATDNNAVANGIAPNRYLVTTDAHELEQHYQIVVANILAGPLCDLSDAIASYLKPGQPLVLSGILAHQADAVMAAYSQTIAFDPVVTLDGWVRLSGRRK
ncbi:50S ribosomal protein L11 methyltransferase [Reinekea sp.]|jgi:ribosomal protein L11 methyltransferase|uniref:50S ribosomal protein L11 methyltransferase n=1 Tax=Reinekea sp. TaxID=1970455 RepID=UPI002A83A41F|nr:50S ribosomal protein L11 methyltransferase [Reinekea sp.]